MKKLILFGLVLLILSSFGLALTNDDLDHYFSLEELLSPYNNELNATDGTAITSPSTNDSINGIGQDFDNNIADNYIDTNIDVTSSAFSISAWTYKNTSSDITAILLATSTNANPTQGFYLSADNVHKTYFSVGDTSIAGSNNDFDPFTWYFFSFTYDGTDNWTLYRNGVKLGSVTKAGVTHDTNLIIGGRTDQASTDFLGMVDEVAVWNRRLTDAEMLDLYNSGVGLFYPFTSANFSLTANAVNGSAIQSFSLYDENTGGLLFSTTDGQINTSFTGSEENLTVASSEDGGYFNKTYLNYNTSTNLIAELFQVEVSFTATELLSGDNVTGANFTDGAVSGTTLELNAGTYNITFFNSTTEHYNKTQEFTYSALQNTSSIVTGVYDHELNITAIVATNSSAITEFNINVTSENPAYNLQYTTTDGNILAGLEQGYNHTIILDHPDYALQEVNFTPTNSSNHYQFDVYTTNSFNFTFLDELTNETITDLIEIEFVSDTNSYNYTTTTGSLYVDLLVPSTYTIRYSSANYGRIREFHYILTNQTHQELTLYLLTDGNSTSITVNVYDKLTVEGVQGAIVYLQRYEIVTNDYQTIAMYTTDVSGTAYFDVEADNEYYKILVDFPFLTRKYTSTPFYISATTYNIYISLLENIGESFFEEQGIISAITYDNNTDTFTATWTDGSVISSQFCLRIKKYGVYSLTTLNESCSTSSSGSIALSGLEENTTNYAVLYATIDGVEKVLTSTWKTKFSDTLDYGTMGVFMSVILVGVFSLLLSFHSLSLILGSGGLIFSKLLGLIPMDWNYIIGIMVLAILLNLALNLWKR
jgi:hypothetical protein